MAHEQVVQWKFKCEKRCIYIKLAHHLITVYVQLWYVRLVSPLYSHTSFNQCISHWVKLSPVRAFVWILWHASLGLLGCVDKVEWPLLSKSGIAVNFIECRNECRNAEHWVFWMWGCSCAKEHAKSPNISWLLSLNTFVPDTDNFTNFRSTLWILYCAQ